MKADMDAAPLESRLGGIAPVSNPQPPASPPNPEEEANGALLARVSVVPALQQYPAAKSDRDAQESLAFGLLLYLFGYFGPMIGFDRLRRLTKTAIDRAEMQERETPAST